MTGLGTVVAIQRYPVKSMRSESLDTAELHWTGLHGDRQYAFCKTVDTSDFPWLTARDLPELVLHTARYSEPDAPKRARLLVTAPDGTECDVTDPALAGRLAEGARAPVRLLRIGRGAFDAMPVSILTTTSADAVSEAQGAPVGLGRFRANLVVRPDDPAASEQDWLGRTLTLGDGPNPPSLRVDLPIPRCAIIAIDPATGTRDASVLRTVVQRFQNHVGVYCTVQAPGVIRMGDRVAVSGKCRRTSDLAQ